MATDTLEAARILAARSHFRDAVSRAYYSMFYAAKSAIVSEGLRASKHSTVISLFGPYFAKTGRVSRDIHRSLTSAFDERRLADYTLDWPANQQAADLRIDEAE